MRSLLDVNVVIALLDVDHSQHGAAIAWLSSAAGWITAVAAMVPPQGVAGAPPPAPPGDPPVEPLVVLIPPTVRTRPSR